MTIGPQSPDRGPGPPSGVRAARGFTLVGLLVVLAVIAPLAGYLRPADTFLAFEGSNSGVVFPPQAEDRTPVPAFDDQAHPDTWIFGSAQVRADLDPERHGHGSNDFFADGHVARIHTATVRWRLESGDNFAVIPE